MDVIGEKFLKGIGWGLGFLLVLILFSRFGFSFPLNINSIVTNKNEVFTVSGEGKIIVVPNVAYISLGIETTGSSVLQVQKQINQVNNLLLETLKKIGISEKDIKTENYNLNSVYEWGEKRRITGYQASTTLKIKIKPLDRVNQVIDEATKVGVNNIYGVSFEVEDKDMYLSQARQQAVAEAKKKAKEAAKATGFHLGKIVNYSETTSSPTIEPIYPLGMIKTNQEEKTNVQPGSQEIKITVNLSYEIK